MGGERETNGRMWVGPLVGVAGSSCKYREDVAERGSFHVARLVVEDLVETAETRFVAPSRRRWLLKV